MAVNIKRKDIEKRLSDFCKVSEISNYLSEKERGNLFDVSLQFAIDAVCFEQAGNKTLGCNVAQSIVRNYLMALLTGNAVKYLMDKGVKKPIIAEMGMGSGLNAVATFVINPKSYYMGIERDDICIGFSCNQFVKYKMEKNVEIIKGDYSSVVLDKKADIVINENFGPNLVEEEQIIASNSVLKYAHKDTVFVPFGMNIYGLFDGKRVEFDNVSFAKQIPLKMGFKVNDVKGEFRPGCDIIDFQGRVALRQKGVDDYISYLPMIGERIIIKKKANKIEFDFSKREIVVG